MKNVHENREWQKELGRQLREQRLRMNLDQRQLAKQAGAALNAVKNLESGRGATISSLVKVLKALGRVDWLTTLAPSVSISPMQVLQARKVRKRASKPRGRRNV
jgi:transcriptional regulator with XRE-family HTH domain